MSAYNMFCIASKFRVFDASLEEIASLLVIKFQLTYYLHGLVLAASPLDNFSMLSFKVVVWA